MALGDFSGATIRDIATLSRILEQKTGQPFIHLEMGVPGLKPSRIGIEAEKKALDEGCAAIYPPSSSRSTSSSSVRESKNFRNTNNLLSYAIRTVNQ